ncbi:MAG: DUF5606 domain-containing protein [Alistipes sp.]|nr:DUF5606 domain-containing protein [Alistipes sp.]
MKLKDILAISGQPGLYKYIAQSKNGVIVESLADGKRSNATSSSRVSALGEISVYTETDEVSLASIFTSMFEKCEGKETISHKSSPDKLKELFAEVLPDYDRDRVHVSDMKKIISWYNILVAAGMTDFSVEDSEDEEAEADGEEEARQE